MQAKEPSRTDEPRDWLRDRKWFQRLVVWGLLILIWEILGAMVGPFTLPRFSQVLVSMFAAFTNGDLATLAGSLLQIGKYDRTTRSYSFQQTDSASSGSLE